MSIRAIDLDSITLARGSHDAASGQMCAMELAAHMAGEPWSDSPACVSPLLANFMRNLNDSLDDKARQALKPVVPLCIGTATGADHDQIRGLMAVDWIVREYTPSWLDLAGLSDDARALRSLPVIDSWDRLVESTPTLIAAQRRSAAARDAARDAAWDAARDAAGDAAWAAAGDAARDAAGDAARAAARAAAWDAAGKRLSQTVAGLQSSAVALAERMALVGK